ncbi:tetratricopeptide repeat protein [Tenacibaculum sp. ZS6-P6]|uniref:tetratricopeptide repeat protein n=1 Tax=Tenacibaculum sp. ZS6-P6 TaxID=3447503 RepID=UPI003F9A8B73
MKKVIIIIGCCLIYLAFSSHYSSDFETIENCLESNYKKKDVDLYLLDSLLNTNIEKNYKFYYKLAVEKKEKGIKTNNIELQILSNRLIAECFLLQNKKSEAFKHLRIANNLLAKRLKKSYTDFSIKYGMALLLMKCEQLDQSLKHFYEALDVLNSLCPEKNHRRFHIYNYIASINFKKNQNQEALKFYFKALNETKELGNNLLNSSAYNNIGCHYYFTKNNKKAESFFIKAKDVLNHEKHPLFLVNIEENLAHIEIERGNFHRALNLYKHVEKVRLKSNENKYDIFSKINQFVCYAKLKNHKKVELTDKVITNYFKERKEIFNERLNRYLKKFINSKLKYLNDNNFKNKTIKFQSEIINKLKLENEQNNTDFKILKDNFLKIQEQNFNDQLELEKEIHLSKQEAFHKKIIYFIITISLTLLTIIILLMLIRVKNIHQKNQLQINELNELKLKNTVNEKNTLSRELSSVNNKVENILISSKVKRDFLKTILDNINQLPEKKDISNGIKKIKIDIKSKILTEERLITLYQNDSKINLDFIQNLIDKYPKLTKTEREVCSLIKLNLSNKEISQIRGTTIASVKMTRSRIRKKMNLEFKDELNRFIQNI